MEFIGINVAHNDSLERTRAFMNSTGMDYPVIFDETKKLSRQYGVQSVPTIVLVDKKGKVVLKAHAAPEISEQRFISSSISRRFLHRKISKRFQVTANGRQELMMGLVVADQGLG